MMVLTERALFLKSLSDDEVLDEPAMKRWQVDTSDAVPGKTKVGPGRHSSPRHLTRFEPSFVELYQVGLGRYCWPRHLKHFGPSFLALIGFF
jgi:hypothetical protein